jgi:hypothetical protein
MEKDVKKILEMQEYFENNRKQLEDNWKEVASFVRPQREKNNDTRVLYDSTAILSAEYLINALLGLSADYSTNFFEVIDKKDRKNLEILEYLKTVEKTLTNNIFDNKNSFYQKLYEFYADLVCFGSAIFYVGADVKYNNVRYEVLNLENTYFGNILGSKIDTVFEKIFLNVEQIKEMFPDFAFTKQLKDFEIKNDNSKLEVIHAVLPVDFLDTKKAKLKNMKFASYYILKEEGSIICIDGYYELPYICARWNTYTNECYGSSPALSAMADIKIVNSMMKSILIATQKEVDPPMLVPNEMSISGIRTNPGGVIYGGIDPITGNQMFRPLVSNFNMAGVLEVLKQRQEIVKEAFLYSLFSIFNISEATATEINNVNDQRKKLLSAKISRIQNEFLYPFVLRHYFILNRMGELPLLPENMEINDIDFVFKNYGEDINKKLKDKNLEDLLLFITKIENIKPEVIENVNFDEILASYVKVKNLDYEILKNLGN